MPVNSRWIGGGSAQAQLAFVVPASVTIGNVFSVTINNKTVTYVAASATVADVTAGLAAAIAASSYPEFASSEVVATDESTYLLLTAGTPGQPFAATASAAVGTGTGTPTLTLSAALTVPTNGTFSTAVAGGTLAAGTYYYRISAVNAAGETTASTESSQATSPVAVPVQTAPALASSGSLTVATPYYWVVTATTGAGETTKSNEVTLTPTSGNQKGVLNWGAVTGATGYNVYRSTTSGTYGASSLVTTIGSGATVTYTDTGSSTTSGQPPGSNTATTATNTVGLTWTRSPGATGYRIYGRGTGAELYLVGVQGEGTLAYTDTGALSPSGALPGGNTTGTPNQGPHSWATAANWSANAVPAGSDTITIDLADQILYDLSQSAVTLASLTITPGFASSGSAQLGLPRVNAAGYTEYRTRELTIGITALTVNTDAQLLRFNLGSVQTAATVYGTGSSSETNLNALTIKGTNASNTLDVLSGDVGVAVLGGEVATFATVTNAGSLTLGLGVTWTTLVTQGGSALVQSAGTTLTIDAGTVTRLGAGAITTVNLWSSGAFNDFGTGTIGTVNVGGALAASADVGRTYSVVNGYQGGSMTFDPHKLTLSAGIALEGLSLGQFQINAGPSINVQVTGL